MRTTSPPRESAHAGLIFYRYYEGKTADKEGNRLLERVQAASQNAAANYRPAFNRRDALLAEAGYARADFATAKNTRVAVGLGIDSPIEIGLRLHYTYGVPVLPGSAIKGVTAAYCRQFLNWKCDDEPYAILFGNTEESGLVDFEDAWFLPQSISGGSAGTLNGLVRDVVTPHHPRYYSGSQQRPLDSDEPTPIAHLSVAGTFRVAVCADKSLKHRDEWQDRAMDAVEDALRHLGIGGRTRAGYGRMTRLPTLTGA